MTDDKIALRALLEKSSDAAAGAWSGDAKGQVDLAAVQLCGAVPE